MTEILLYPTITSHPAGVGLPRRAGVQSPGGPDLQPRVSLPPPLGSHLSLQQTHQCSRSFSLSPNQPHRWGSSSPRESLLRIHSQDGRGGYGEKGGGDAQLHVRMSGGMPLMSEIKQAGEPGSPFVFCQNGFLCNISEKCLR